MSTITTEFAHISRSKRNCPDSPPDSALQRRKSRSHPKTRWRASSRRTARRMICLGFLLTNGCMAVRTPSSEDLRIGGFFYLDRGSAARGFGFRSLLSFERINSIAILAAARTPVQMEFLIGTGRRRLFADCSIPDRPDILQGNLDTGHFGAVRELFLLKCFRHVIFRTRWRPMFGVSAVAPSAQSRRASATNFAFTMVVMHER
jgi:hypothetical protein